MEIVCGFDSGGERFEWMRINSGTFASDINELGQIVTTRGNPPTTDNPITSFFDVGGVFSEHIAAYYDFSGEYEWYIVIEPHWINNAGQVVGWIWLVSRNPDPSGPGGDENRFSTSFSFLWDSENGFQDFSSIVPALSGREDVGFETILRTDGFLTISHLDDTRFETPLPSDIGIGTSDFRDVSDSLASIASQCDSSLSVGSTNLAKSNSRLEFIDGSDVVRIAVPRLDVVTRFSWNDENGELQPGGTNDGLPGWSLGYEFTIENTGAYDLQDLTAEIEFVDPAGAEVLRLNQTSEPPATLASQTRSSDTGRLFGFFRAQQPGTASIRVRVTGTNAQGQGAEAVSDVLNVTIGVPPAAMEMALSIDESRLFETETSAAVLSFISRTEEPQTVQFAGEVLVSSRPESVTISGLEGIPTSFELPGSGSRDFTVSLEAVDGGTSRISSAVNVTSTSGDVVSYDVSANVDVIAMDAEFLLQTPRVRLGDFNDDLYLLGVDVTNTSSRTISGISVEGDIRIGPISVNGPRNSRQVESLTAPLTLGPGDTGRLRFNMQALVPGTSSLGALVVGSLDGQRVTQFVESSVIVVGQEELEITLSAPMPDLTNPIPGESVPVTLLINNNSSTAVVESLVFEGSGDGVVTTQGRYDEFQQGGISLVSGPSRALPDHLEPGQSVTLNYLIRPESVGLADLVSKARATFDSGAMVEVGHVLTFGLGLIPPSQEELLEAGIGLIDYTFEQNAKALTDNLDAQSKIMQDLVDGLGGGSAGSRCGSDEPAQEPANIFERKLAESFGQPPETYAWLPDDPIDAYQLMLAWHEGQSAGAREIVAEEGATYLEIARMMEQFLFDPAARSVMSREIGNGVRNGLFGAFESFGFGYDVTTGADPERRQAYVDGLVQAKPQIDEAALALSMQFCQEFEDQVERIESGDLEGAVRDAGRLSGRVKARVSVEVGKTIVGERALDSIVRASPLLTRQARTRNLAKARRAAARNSDPRFIIPDGPFKGMDRRVARAAGIGDDLINIDNVIGVNQSGLNPAQEARLSMILDDLGGENGLNLEAEFRTLNPHSNAKYIDAQGRRIGTPKEETLSAKTVTSEDVMLGVKPDYLGEAAVYNPVLPPYFNDLPKDRQASLRDRFDLQRQNFRDSTNPDTKLGGNLSLASNENGHNFPIPTPGGGTRFVPMHVEIVVDGNTRLIRDASTRLPDGSAVPFISDLDSNSLLVRNPDGTTRKIPAGSAPKIELEYIRRVRQDNLLPGPLHGITLNGFDLPSNLTNIHIKYIAGAVPPDNAREQVFEYVNRINRQRIDRNTTPDSRGNLPTKQLPLLDASRILSSVEREKVIHRATSSEVITVDFGADLVDLAPTRVNR